MMTSAELSTEYGLLRITGVDAGKFLQGQITCDIKELTEQKALPGAYCTAKGRIRSNFIILQYKSDDFLMILPKQQVSFLQEALAPYIAFFQCAMTNDSERWYLFGLQNDQKADTLMANDPFKIKKNDTPDTVSNELITIGLPGDIPRWLCLSEQTLDNTIPHLPLMTLTNWQKQNMLSGLVWIDETNRDKFLPHDISLPELGAVSFTKGCYVGQEIIARMQYRGKPKYLLAVITTEPTKEKPPPQLSQTTDNSEQFNVGEVINMLHQDDNSWLILASVKRTLINQQQFKLSSGDRSLLCSIIRPYTVKENNKP